MAKYYMEGYTPPSGVNSASAVKEYQRQLGVKADGIWGPDTEAAYQNSIKQTQSYPSIPNMDVDESASRFQWGDTSPSASADDLFASYFNSIKNSLTPTTITVKAPSKSEISSMWSEVLRPTYDAAIEERQEAAGRNMAELDADAAARGMGSSSYVSSLKAREMEDAQEDIDDMEAQYGAALAEKIYDSLYEYSKLSLDAQKYNASAAADAQKAAMNMASDWYTQYLKQTASSSSGSSSSGKSSSSSGSSGSNKSSLSKEDYTEYVQNLSSSQQRLLFNSTSEYWASRREELHSALGSTLYNSLKNKYGG